MTILVTGIAGFIGSHLAKSLLKRGEKILGIDNLSNYYDVNLKKDRLNNLKVYKNLTFKKKADIFFRVKRLIDNNNMGELFKVMFISRKKNRFNQGF